MRLNNLSELHIELPDAGVSMRLNHLKRAGVLRRVSGEDTIDDSLHTWMAEGEDLLARREDDNGDLGTAKGAKLTCFFEEAGAAFREGHLEVTVV